jgi:hypothetical protein
VCHLFINVKIALDAKFLCALILVMPMKGERINIRAKGGKPPLADPICIIILEPNSTIITFDLLPGETTVSGCGGAADRFTLEIFGSKAYKVFTII